ncbi:MAG: AAA family ATPase [Paracoccaceae bacterium]
MKQLAIGLRELNSRMPPDDTRAAETLNLRGMLAMLRRQSRPLVIATAIGLGAGVAYLLTSPAQYYAASKVLVDEQLSRLTEEISTSDAAVRDDAALMNEVEVLKSQQLASAVIDDLDIAANPVLLDHPASGARRLLDGVVKPVAALLKPAQVTSDAADDPAATPAERAEQEKKALATKLAADIIVSPVGRSYVIEIGYMSHDPAFAARVANSYADAYLSDQLVANFSAKRRTAEWMQTRLVQLQSDAQAAELAVEAFKAEYGLIADRDQTRERVLAEQKLEEIEAELSRAQSVLDRAQSRADGYAQLLDGGAEAIADAVATASLPSNEGRLGDLASRYATASAAERNGLSQEIASELRSLSAAATRSVDNAAARVRQLTADRAEPAAKIDRITSAQIGLRELEQRAATLNGLFQSFSARREAIELQESFPVSSVRILTNAEVPKTAAAPNAVRILPVAMLLGTLVGLIFAIRREFRERFFRTGEDVHAVTGLPFLGYLPSVSPPRRSRATRRAAIRKSRSDKVPWQPEQIAPVLFEVLSEPHSMFVETLRNVRVAAELPGGGACRVIGVMSVLPGEGKTMTAGNLANLLSCSGARTLLIDCDLRRPGLSESLQVRSGPGLGQVLLGEAELGEAIRRVPATGLDILPCTRSALFGYASEILRLPRLKSVLDEARAQYEFIIFDLPPVGAVVDTKIVLPHLDSAVLVTEWGKTPRDLVCQQVLRDPLYRGKLLGVLLNKVRLKALAKYSDLDGAENYLNVYSDYRVAR